MKSKKQQLNDLFTQWKTEVDDYKTQFITDGIVNEKKYDKADTKILFIAKEPNDQSNESWYYRDFLLDYKAFHYSFLYRLAEWAYGILNDFPPIEELWMDDRKLHQVFTEIAFMNVKKSGGVGSTSPEILEPYIQRSLKLLQKEIDIIDPEIIVNSLSWESTTNMLFPDVNWISSGYNINIGKYNSAKVIDFYHPSSRNAPAAVYSLLQNVIQSEQFKNL